MQVMSYTTENVLYTYKVSMVVRTYSKTLKFTRRAKSLCDLSRGVLRLRLLGEYFNSKHTVQYERVILDKLPRTFDT